MYNNKQSSIRLPTMHSTQRSVVSRKPTGISEDNGILRFMRRLRDEAIPLCRKQDKPSRLDRRHSADSSTIGLKLPIPIRRTIQEGPRGPIHHLVKSKGVDDSAGRTPIVSTTPVACDRSVLCVTSLHHPITATYTHSPKRPTDFGYPTTKWLRIPSNITTSSCSPVSTSNSETRSSKQSEFSPQINSSTVNESIFCHQYPTSSIVRSTPSHYNQHWSKPIPNEKINTLHQNPHVKHQRLRNIRWKDKEFRQRLELIQDLDFPISCGRIRLSEDGQYIGCVGIYPPELKVFDTNELGLKFARGFDAEVVDFDFLSSDYKKLAFLHPDRSVEFHAQGGRHHIIRIPKHGRSVCYIKDTAELLVVGSSNEIYRFDLEAGMFGSPITTECEEINCCKNSPKLPVLFVGGSGGIVEVFDYRQWSSVGTLKVACDGDDEFNGKCVTALDLSSDGLLMCAGTTAGICRVYDIRSSRPVAERNHRNLCPIVDLQFVKGAKHLERGAFGSQPAIVSADTQAVKIWRMGDEDSMSRENLTEGHAYDMSPFGTHQGTKLIASLEPDSVSQGGTNAKIQKKAGAINSMAVYPESGLIFVAQDNPRIGVYFVPELGIAPRWCSFLDFLTEEMEEAAKETVYDGMQFVTNSQLQDLGAEHLIGTSLLRAYMHGHFMDARLYHKLKAVAQPFVLEESRKQRIQEKLESKRKMRIQVKRKLPDVNPKLAEKLEENAASKNQKSAAMAKAILTDDRFSQLFTNPGFAIETVPISEPIVAAKYRSSTKTFLNAHSKPGNNFRNKKRHS